ncbi:RNA polymerase sigma factor [Balneola vulgaris]|uniref:RNA polymerase sigma factor n=1 Tax=Balneola vulgaris TaxID=287535 RepID=UPI00037CF9F0|nr:sigma-70 family RNA polymerase sigma factor [Balneola vulgaris]
MDYPKFVTAVLENDRKQLNEFSEVLTRVLIKFLLVRLDANPADAQDCAQNTLMLVIDKIRANKLNNPDSIIYYLFTTAKNDYLKLVAKHRESHFEEVPDTYIAPADQLENILDKERQSILKKCMELLKPKQLKYISYWFEHPDNDASVVAAHFKISVNNAWTKKHRILQVLKDCVQKKLQQ